MVQMAGKMWTSVCGVACQRCEWKLLGEAIAKRHSEAETAQRKNQLLI